MVPQRALSWLWFVHVLVPTLACGGGEQDPGAIVGASRSPALRAEGAATAVTAGLDKPILFGDLHVHTSYSIDAFVFALPLFGGEGALPPADACDFARHCSALDFFSLNDHAEALTPARWLASQDSIRECNEIAGDPADPDLVAFMGYEWTQAGPTPEAHYGHKNVIFRGLEPYELPARPITSLPDGTMDRARGVDLLAVFEFLPRLGTGIYGDFLWWIRHMAAMPDCPVGVDSPSLPVNCRENAETPDLLFEKLAQWDLDPLVIPHGLAWGIHAPPGSSIANQLTRSAHDGERQRLIEVFSGHGNSEEFRELPESAQDASGDRVCPERTSDYLACCWRAGEIVRDRCVEPESAECQARVDEAQQLALNAGVSPHLVLPDTTTEDWLDCDQCRDCFKPAMNLRPKESAQYAAAISNFDEPAEDGSPQRFRFGFIASSDTHTTRPGTGYKQFARGVMSDSRGMASPFWDGLTRSWIWGSQEDPGRAQPAPVEDRGFRGLLDVEREASFMYPGGLVAVHSWDRSRDAIWNALERREVYGTSGPRILLWFDLLSDETAPAPMGSEVTLAGTPRFRARAVGSPVQQPGCPADAGTALGNERLELLCRGECYHPSDQRRVIEAIEVIRIRPQAKPDEDVAPLIEDPWQTFPCDPNPAEGCTVEFEDLDYEPSGRDAVYYVRALEAPSLAINGANIRAEFDDAGNAIRTTPCYGGYQTPADDDCLAPVRERAWSSPIYVDRPH